MNHNKTIQINHASLFSGMGGFDLAAGNAIVPQVALEIYKVIEKIEQNNAR